MHLLGHIGKEVAAEMSEVGRTNYIKQRNYFVSLLRKTKKSNITQI